MEDADHKDSLLALALAVVDGEAVDWERECERTPERRADLDRLRLLATLARETGAPSAEPVSEAPAFHWGNLEGRRRLGQGTFGEVWAAWDPALHREVALKLRRDDAPGGSARWLVEARRLARVRHPNVLTVYGADEHDGRVGLWSELIDGVTLERWLAERGPMGPREAALVGLDLCAALAAVHAEGLAHGDVKAANVMRAGAAEADVRASGRIVLMDFGSAHERGDGGGLESTPAAAAPELLRGDAPTVRSDLYALGVLLYRLVTGRSPIEADTLDELRRGHERGATIPLRSARPDLPAAFVAVVEQALSADPAARYANAGEMERALRATLGAPVASRGKWLFLGALAALIVAALWLGAAHRPNAALVPGGGSNGGVSGGDLNGGAPSGGSNSTGGIGASPANPSAAAPGGAPGSGAPSGTTALPAPLSVRATLYRVGERGREALADGDRVSPGDQLFLELSSASAVHVYVLNEDDSAHVFVLFPLPNRGLHNPLAAAATHRLPGREKDGELDWEVTSSGGEERFLIVASAQPLAAVERAVAAFRPSREGTETEYAPLDDGALSSLRGVGRVVRREATASTPPGRLAALEREWAKAAPSEVWTRLVVLRNP